MFTSKRVRMQFLFRHRKKAMSWNDFQILALGVRTGEVFGIVLHSPASLILCNFFSESKGIQENYSYLLDYALHWY
jgi:hypothetical protein